MGAMLLSQQADTESKPLREKLLPQASLRFLLLLIGGSAVMMFIFRMALVQDNHWAKVTAMLFTMIVACFVAYATLFLLANLFSVSTRPLRSALGYESTKLNPSPEEK